MSSVSLSVPAEFHAGDSAFTMSSITRYRFPRGAGMPCAACLPLGSEVKDISKDNLNHTIINCINN